MIGICFSGTGNTRYCVEKFLKVYDADAETFFIEEDCASRNTVAHKELCSAYCRNPLK